LAQVAQVVVLQTLSLLAHRLAVAAAVVQSRKLHCQQHQVQVTQ
jgi:hypothetical protein